MMYLPNIALLFASIALGCDAYQSPVSVPPLKSASASPSSSSPVPKAPPVSPLSDFDYTKNARLPWVADGYGTWEWRGHDINYLEMGDKSKPALLLIHGFGASAYHYRHNIPVLARDYHVFAFDMLGFGLSSKPIEDYSAEVWRDQTVDFISDVVGKPTTVAGNSLGGFTALYAASSHGSGGDRDEPGRFRDPSAPAEEERKKNMIVEKISSAIQRAVIGLSFIYTKQPARIEQVLKQVYPVNSENVDAELVESIQLPSQDPNAAEVFYRVITKNGSGPSVYVDDLLERLDCPLLLLWGESDPWIRPAAADRIQALYPRSRRVSVDAGHCPQDENPEAVNLAICEFMEDIFRQ